MSRALGDSEVGKNAVWREMIVKEEKACANRKTVYACNLNMLRAMTTTNKPGAKLDERMVLTAEEEAEAIAILESYGHKTKETDPSEIIVPLTSNKSYGAYNFYAKKATSANNKKTCEETRYGDTYFKAFRKSAFSNKK